MKIFFISFLFVFLVVNTQGQIALKKTCISSGGRSTTIGANQVIYTIGEVVILEQTQNNIHISEGFIGSDILRSLGVADFLDLKGIKVYPNPTIDIIQIDHPNGNFEITLYDINGKLLLSKLTNTDSHTQINIQHLAISNYILLIKNKYDKHFKTFKIIKK